MRKEDFNKIFRDYIRENLSPTKEEKNLASSIYESIKNVLGDKCFLIGSFARYTTIRPLHDLDILYIAGEFNPENIDPNAIIAEVKRMIEQNFQNPTKHNTKIFVQSHSITVQFLENNEEVFSVDVVPAFISGITNEFGDDIYYVPEILRINHQRRRKLYEELERSKKKEIEWWIKSDPRGYTTVASNLNKLNNDFRKSVKFVKKWKSNCKEIDDGFSLKSFHIEQVITKYFLEHCSTEIFDAIFKFFCELPKIIARAQIPDRADETVNIDTYINNLSNEQREQIIKARDCFLIKLENFQRDSSINKLLDACFYERKSDTEEYLFDTFIPILTEEDAKFKIDGYVQLLKGYSAGWLSKTPQLQKGLTRGEGKTRFIKFEVIGDGLNADLFKWKVKNDDKCEEPRGEITDNRTKRERESTAYPGNHYVECFAIKDGVCISRAKRSVIIL